MKMYIVCRVSSVLLTHATEQKEQASNKQTQNKNTPCCERQQTTGYELNQSISYLSKRKMQK